MYLPSCFFPPEMKLPGPLSFSRSPGVSFLKAGAGLAAGLVPDPHTLYSREHCRSGRKDLSEPGESEGTALQAQMRWEGPFLTVICGCLLGGPYVPCLQLAKWNSWLVICIRWFFSQFLQLFDEGVREGGANHLFCGLRWHLIQLFLVFLRSAPPRPPPSHTCCQGHSPHKGKGTGNAFSPSVIFKNPKWIQATNSW